MTNYMQYIPEGRYCAIWYGNLLDGVTRNRHLLRRAAMRQGSSVLMMPENVEPPFRFNDIPRPKRPGPHGLKIVSGAKIA